VLPWASPHIQWGWCHVMAYLHHSELILFISCLQSIKCFWRKLQSNSLFSRLLKGAIPRYKKALSNGQNSQSAIMSWFVLCSLFGLAFSHAINDVALIVGGIGDYSNVLNTYNTLSSVEIFGCPSGKSVVVDDFPLETYFTAGTYLSEEDAVTSLWRIWLWKWRKWRGMKFKW